LHGNKDTIDKRGGRRQKKRVLKQPEEDTNHEL
jgi:hypothetical protein